MTRGINRGGLVWPWSVGHPKWIAGHPYVHIISIHNHNYTNHLDIIGVPTQMFGCPPSTRCQPIFHYLDPTLVLLKQSSAYFEIIWIRSILSSRMTLWNAREKSIIQQEYYALSSLVVRKQSIFVPFMGRNRRHMLTHIPLPSIHSCIPSTLLNTPPRHPHRHSFHC